MECKSAKKTRSHSKGALYHSGKSYRCSVLPSSSSGHLVYAHRVQLFSSALPWLEPPGLKMALQPLLLRPHKPSISMIISLRLPTPSSTEKNIPHIKKLKKKYHCPYPLTHTVLNPKRKVRKKKIGEKMIKNGDSLHPTP